jgi:hypothetical protein
MRSNPASTGSCLTRSGPRPGASSPSGRCGSGSRMRSGWSRSPGRSVHTTTAPASLQQNDPQYFRQYVFDTLDQTGWQLAGYPPGTAQASSLSQPPGLTDLSAAEPVSTTVTTTGFSGAHPAFLPLPYPEIPGQRTGTVAGRPGPDDLLSGQLAGRHNLLGGQLRHRPQPGAAGSRAPLTGIPGLAPDLQLPRPTGPRR